MIAADAACDDDPERAEESLMKAVPRNRRQVYKMRPSSTRRRQGSSSRWARISPLDHRGSGAVEGRAVLLLASDPFTMAAPGRRMRARRWCATRLRRDLHLPVVYLMDCPGFMIGLDAEKAATIRHGVPRDGRRQPDHRSWCTIIVRNASASPRRASAGRPVLDALRLAVAYWGSLRWKRHRGRLSRRHRRRRRSESQVGEIEDRLTSCVRRFVRLNGSGREIIDPR